MTGWTVVGAGLTGATVARRLADSGVSVVVVDRREQVGGNAADTPHTHLYGPHIFHTNSERVVDWLSRFTEWRPYDHRVVAELDGVGRVPMPVNLTTIDLLFGERAGELVAEKLVAEYGVMAQVPIEKLRASRDIVISKAGQTIFDTFFDGYTRKMWGRDAERLSPGVTARVPVRLSHDDRYFTDKFQCQPAAGYAAMFDAMLRHEKITVLLEAEYPLRALEPGRTVYTGPADELFDFEFGPLPYRSLSFEVTHQGEPRSMPPAATVNYPSEKNPYTRETEMGLVTGSGVNHQVRERPLEHVPGQTEPYYPIPAPGNRDRWDRYSEAARAHGIILAGRLGDYKYYNMDQAVARGLTVARQIVGGEE